MDKVTWNDVLNAPTFVVNMDRRKDRLDVAIRRIRDAGFKNVQRYRAIDGANDDLTEAWKKHGPPIFSSAHSDFLPNVGRQGCALSHYGIWQYMFLNNIPFLVVFEDDVEFHHEWHNLSGQYWEHTPRDFDILYLGAQMDTFTEGNITVTPVFCTHAYIITLEGAKKLYDLCLKSPTGTYTIDCMLIDHMKATFATNGRHHPFKWYVWNGRMFPDPNKVKEGSKWASRNDGLVFQDYDLGTDVIHW